MRRVQQSGQPVWEEIAGEINVKPILGGCNEQ
jgi:hypothetical protein